MKSNRDKTLQLLAEFESQNITFLDPDGAWPIIWERARGMYVWDTAGKRYLDWTSAFGVASCGHSNPRVVRAGQRQMRTLLHAMGDVHPHPLKATLARTLSACTFERWPGGLRGKTIFCNSGFEAVEAALKTAFLATGRPGVIAFHGAYHGLGYGALNATHRDHFRARFVRQLGEFAVFMPFPVAGENPGPVLDAIDSRLKSGSVGAVLVEPIQGRAGIRIPAERFLSGLRALCDRHGALLICDEIYTGFGRTGRWFACERDGVTPDLICLGKALTGGFPLSACVGRSDVMDAAWPKSAGEAMHTSTFLGHPVGCAMAMAQIEEIRGKGLVERSSGMGTLLVERLKAVVPPVGLRWEVRGAGLFVGMEMRLEEGAPATRFVWRVVKELLRAGYILLPEGESGNVLAFAPPLIVTQEQIRSTVRALQSVLENVLQDQPGGSLSS